MTDDDVILVLFFVMVYSLINFFFFALYISKLIICLFQMGKLFPSNVIKKWDKLH